MYRVSIELYKHEWKFGRTRNAVGTRAAGECFHSFFEFSQTFTSIKIYLCNAARLRDIRQVPDDARRPLSAIVPSTTDSSTASTDWDSSGTPITSQGNDYPLLLVCYQNKGHK